MKNLFILGFLCLQLFSWSGNSYGGYEKPNSLQNRKFKPFEFYPIDQWRLFIDEIVKKVSPRKLNQRLEETYFKHQRQLSWQHVEVLLDSLTSDIDGSQEGLYSKENVERRVISLYYRIYFDVSYCPNLLDFKSMKSRFKRASKKLDQLIQIEIENQETQTSLESENNRDELEQGRKFLASHLHRVFVHLEELHDSARKTFQDTQGDAQKKVWKLNELDQTLVNAMNSLRGIKIMIKRMEMVLTHFRKSYVLGDKQVELKKYELELEFWKSHYLSLSYQTVEAIQSLSRQAHQNWKITSEQGTHFKQEF